MKHSRKRNESRSRSRSRSRSCSRSPTKSKHRHRRSSRRPSNVESITQGDYFKYNTPFRLWLRKEKDLYFDEMTTEKARKYFGSFVRAWNEGRLRSKYYQADGDLTSLSKNILTRHSWGFDTKPDTGSATRSRLEEPPRSAHIADSADQQRVQGPSMPSRLERPPETNRLFDEEQRERNRHSRKSERRKAREREEIILDEVAPKETGREAALAKKRAINQHRHSEKNLDVEIHDDDLYMDSTNDLVALKQSRELREKQRIERKQAKHEENNGENRLKERMDKERSTIEMLRAMAKQSREQGLGMNNSFKNN